MHTYTRCQFLVFILLDLKTAFDTLHPNFLFETFFVWFPRSQTYLIFFLSCGSPCRSSLLVPSYLLHLQTLACVVEGMSLVLFSPPSVSPLPPAPTGALIQGFQSHLYVVCIHVPISNPHLSLNSRPVCPIPTPIATRRVGIQNGRIFPPFFPTIQITF